MEVEEEREDEEREQEQEHEQEQEKKDEQQIATVITEADFIKPWQRGEQSVTISGQSTMRARDFHYSTIVVAPELVNFRYK